MRKRITISDCQQEGKIEICQNSTDCLYDSNNEFEIPNLLLEKQAGKLVLPLVGYGSVRRQSLAKTIHFFIDDYQFDRIWASPDLYCNSLSRFKYVMSPDFSIYTDTPYCMQLWKHYQKQWFGCYMQVHGIDVIPTVGWADERSFEFCFDGIPMRSVVAVSSVGTQADKDSIRRFEIGYRRMMKVLRPTQVLFYGKVPDGLTAGINVIHIPHYFNDRFKKMRNGR